MFYHIPCSIILEMTDSFDKLNNFIYIDMANSEYKQIFLKNCFNEAYVACLHCVF